MHIFVRTEEAPQKVLNLIPQMALVNLCANMFAANQVTADMQTHDS